MQLGQLTKLTKGEEAADNGGGSIGDGAGVHNAIDAKDEREDDDQRQQEEYLPCKRHDHTKPGFSNGSKKAGRHRLDPVGKGHQHEDAEIFFCKMKVQVAAVSEDAYDLMREELEAILQKAGYRTSGITDFENAAAAILAASPDLVLLDLNLPGMGGFQICRELKQKSSIPVLVLTSRDQLQDELHALDLGADEFLTKPCRKERLLARVSNLLKRYQGRNNLMEANRILLDRQT